MVCPNCGSNMSDKRKRCDRCGSDLELYKKILKASNMYYNNGLARAKVRDLSGAIIALRNSLELNKQNIDARNLLGLIYFEMGETVAALSEWVISKHFQSEDNDADDYINEVQSNPTKLDNLNQAIKRYNNALISAKQGSDDLAIIQLKKVIALNSHFIRAYHLLTLVYMRNGDNDKAKKCLLKASKIDVSNTTTLRYLREFEPNITATKDSDADQEKGQNVASIMPVSSYKEDKPNIMAFVNLVIGVIIGIAVVSFLIVPSITRQYKQEENQFANDYRASLIIIQGKDETIQGLEQERAELQDIIQQLRGDLANVATPEEMIEVYRPVFDVAKMYIDEMSKENLNDRDIVRVAEALAAVNMNQFRADSPVNLLTRLKADIYPKAANSHFALGNNLYTLNQFENAIVELERAIYYNPQHVDALYFLARSYHRHGDLDNARVYYNIIITDFPDTRRASQSQSYLNTIR